MDTVQINEFGFVVLPDDLGEGYFDEEGRWIDGDYDNYHQDVPEAEVSWTDEELAYCF